MSTKFLCTRLIPLMIVAVFAVGLLDGLVAQEEPTAAVDEAPAAAEADEAAAPEEGDAAAAEAEDAATEADPNAAPEVAGEKKGDEELTRAQALIETIKKGKEVGYVLIGISVFGVAFALERLFRLRRGAIVPAGVSARADQLWQAEKYDDIRKLCNRRGSTLGRIILAMVDHRDIEKGDLRTLAEDIGSRELRGHLQRAYPLAVVATISPLLGLMGTVFGMITCFDKVAIADELGSPSMLADGISQALVTTAMGLVVAVPALALYHYFRNRTTQFALSLDEEVSELIRRWFLGKGTTDV